MTLVYGFVECAPGAEAVWETMKGFSTEVLCFPELARPPSNPKVLLSQVRRLGAILAERQAAVVHCHGRSLLPALWLLSKTRRLCVVETVHLSLRSPQARRRTLATRIGAMAYRVIAGHRVIAISSEMMRELSSRFSLDSPRVVPINNGIDTDYFRPPSVDERKLARARFGLGENQFAIAIVGRVHPEQKGHDVLAQAVRSLSLRGVHWGVLCAGYGGDPAKNLIRATLASPENLRRWLFLEHTDPREVYWASDCLALPSRVEGFPLVVAEAMACGLTTVRTPTQGSADQIVDGVTGLLFPVDDAQRCADLLEQCAGDPDLRARVGAAARVRAVERFGIDQMIEKTLQAYGF